MDIRKSNLSFTKNDNSDNKALDSNVDKNNSLQNDVSKIYEDENFEENISIRKAPKIEVNEIDLSPDHLKRISNANMEELVELAKEVHPLPREFQMEIKKTHRNYFISKLRKINTENELVDFAFQLTHRELALLFPVLATSNRLSINEKIKKIITLRSSKVLYAHGWVTLQYIYPDNRFAKNISNLCRDLENENFHFQKLMETSAKEDKIAIKSLPYPHFDWSNIRLITEISAPDNRRFMNSITNYILENELSLKEFFYQFGIYDDLALGLAIQKNYDVEKLEKSIGFNDNNRTSWRELFQMDKDDSDELY